MPRGTRIANPGDLRQAARTTADGDIDADLARLRMLTATERLGVIRHELTHAALLETVDKRPALPREGIAMQESFVGFRKADTAGSELALLSTAFGTRTFGIVALVVAAPARTLDTEIDQLAAGSTVGWIETDRGQTTLV